MPKPSRFLFFFVLLLAAALAHAGGHNNRPLQLVEEEGERFRESNPFLFDDQHFRTIFETEHGRLRLLQNFGERSLKLLAGLLNYRVAILEANPSTFISPAHVDADALFFVPEGKLTINLIRQDRRQTFNLKKGDIIRVPSGTTVYIINTSKTRKLVVVKLFIPVSTPGYFTTFFGPGGQNPESLFNVFSPELLEAAFKSRREKVKTVFGTKTDGAIVKASRQQISAMSRREEGGILRPFGRGEEGGPFNLFEKSATSHSNQYGKLNQISANDNQELRKVNVGISYANITRGGMIGPLFNSKAIKIAIVIRGKGYYEMACPHLSQSESEQQQEHQREREQQEQQQEHQREREQREQQQHQREQREQQQHQREQQQQPGTSGYVRVGGKLQRGNLYVVLPGHPVITVNEGNENLELLCLDVNDLENERFLLAGKKNILSLLEKTALELSLGGVREQESREVIESQTDYLFFKGPNSQQQQQREDA